jgi:glycosyltransferase involved in cell wall biosynthesis
LYNEEESLPELLSWIKRVVDEHRLSCEVIMVDDGSTDSSWSVVQQLASRYRGMVRGIRFQHNYGKSAALFCGFETAQGKVVVTMDADLQDSPDELPALYRMVAVDGYDVASGWKKKRYDPISKRLPSKLYNATVRLITGIKLHDFNCGLKAYKKKVVKSIEVFGDMHRYIPVLAKQAGFKKIGEKVVIHRVRKYGKSKFGWQRLMTGFLDLLSVIFLTKFGKKPMHFFGVLGTLMFLIGMAMAIYLGASKIYRLNYNLPATLITSSPYFFIGLTAMIIGTLLLMSGYLGELIARNAGDRNQYMIEDKI